VTIFPRSGAGQTAGHYAGGLVVPAARGPLRPGWGGE